jgi:hypothetical protein
MAIIEGKAINTAKGLVIMETTLVCRKCEKRELITVDNKMLPLATGTFSLVLTKGLDEGWDISTKGKKLISICPDCAKR